MTHAVLDVVAEDVEGEYTPKMWAQPPCRNIEVTTVSSCDRPRWSSSCAGTRPKVVTNSCADLPRVSRIMKARTLITMSVQLTIANDLAWTVLSGSTAPPLPSIRVGASGENSVGMTGEGQGLREPSGDERGCEPIGARLTGTHLMVARDRRRMWRRRPGDPSGPGDDERSPE